MGTKTRKRIYVAGPYACDGRCDGISVSLEHMRKGLEVCVDLLLRGYAPFCPWLDYLFQFVPGGSKLTLKDYYEYSIAWVPVSDCVYVHAFRDSSVGTIAEIELAEKEGIPIFHEPDFDAISGLYGISLSNLHSGLGKYDFTTF